MNLIIDSAFLPISSLSSESGALITFFRVLKCFRSFFAVVGPMFGNPSSMN